MITVIPIYDYVTNDSAYTWVCLHMFHQFSTEVCRCYMTAKQSSTELVSTIHTDKSCQEALQFHFITQKDKVASMIAKYLDADTLDTGPQ